MDSLLLFIASTLGVFSLWTLYSLRGKNVIEYFKENKGVFSGIKFAFIFTIVLASFSLITGCSNKSYLKDGTVYMGLDVPYSQSPQCVSNSTQVDDKTTSNLGIVVNLYESPDTKFRSNIKYTHHSCAFNTDVRIYDALGVEFTYKIFQR